MGDSVSLGGPGLGGGAAGFAEAVGFAAGAAGFAAAAVPAILMAVTLRAAITEYPTFDSIERLLE